MKRELTQEKLKEYLHYNPESGVFTWAVDRWRVRRGDAAGWVNDQGYILIAIEQVTYRAHQLSWLYVHGSFPEDLIDHKDGDRGNNRISNLRQANKASNCKNQNKHSDNKSGYKGVTWDDIAGKWRAQIYANNKQKYLGLFSCPLDAAKKYDTAAAIFHGEFAKTNKSLNLI